MQFPRYMDMKPFRDFMPTHQVSTLGWIQKLFSLKQISSCNGFDQRHYLAKVNSPHCNLYLHVHLVSFLKMKHGICLLTLHCVSLAPICCAIWEHKKVSAWGDVWEAMCYNILKQILLCGLRTKDLGKSVSAQKQKFSSNQFSYSITFVTRRHAIKTQKGLWNYFSVNNKNFWNMHNSHY